MMRLVYSGGLMRRSPGTGGIFRPTFTAPGGAPRKGRLYWISYTVAGKPKKEPTGSANKQDAERLLRTRLAAIDRGEAPAVGTTKWDDLAEMIRADYSAHGNRSADRLELSLRHLGRAFAGQRAASITSERLAHYIRARLEDGAARASVNRELAALKRAFRLAHRHGRVQAVPYVQMLEERNARTGFFERAAYRKLAPSLPADLRAPILAAYLTGWRLTSELLTRQWHHVDLAAKWLRLEPGETKGGEGRQFPLIPELLASLKAQRRATTALERQAGRVIPWVFHHDGGPLFYRTSAGKVLPSAYLRAAWAAACTQAGLDGRIRHDFRRTAARDLLRAGVPQPTVMRAMGWRSTAMLMRYAVGDEAELIEAGKKRAKLR
jgi:integrase